MKIISLAFKNGEKIPAKYTCDGENTGPPLEISDIPEGAQSLVLIMDDPDAPGKTWDHWIVFNISLKLEARSLKLVIREGKKLDGIGGKNSWGKTGYGGPCPHSDTHRYFFKAYVLDSELDLPEGSGKEEIEESMKGHIISQAELIGLYERQ
jgi:hypothetical protein